ncbi:hypothetical protein [Aminicella lysinilytica]|uniref:hypothetical protein n=1 Tax=Aminicella lysinilytica TaxID=433323 RepID=UPI0026EF1867|nr:hypothetical protein [Aminicella lysinilytica]
MDRSIFYGNIMLIVCIGIYLLWWALAFKPGAEEATTRNGVIIIIAAIVGIIGIIVMVKGIRSVPEGGELFSNKWVIIAGVAAYVALFLFSWFVFKRQVTTELLLIVGWTVLEMIVVNVMYQYGMIMSGRALLVITVIIAAAIIGFICYLLYYNLEGNKAYIDGMIPLVLTGAVTAWITVLTALI